jgi:hypothetical protein
MHVVCKNEMKIGPDDNYVPVKKIPFHEFASTRNIGLHVQCYIGIMNTLTNVNQAKWSLILAVKFCSAFRK